MGLPQLLHLPLPEGADHLLTLFLLLIATFLSTSSSSSCFFGSILVIALLIMFITHRFGDFIYRSYLTLGRDLGGLALLIRVKLDLNRRLRENRPLHEIFLQIVKQHPNKTAVIDIPTGRSLTFEELNQLSNAFANHFQSLGYGQGDVVALFMENCVEFVAAWMGLSKIGVVTAWINSNLRAEPLAHCLRISEAKAVICTQTLIGAVKQCGESGLRQFVLDHESALLEGVTNLSTSLNLTSSSRDEPTPPAATTIDFKSVLCFIYTSGTTGMPKAALMKHFRYYSMVMGTAESFGIFPTDRIYVSMPLYHTSAGILGVGQMLLRGSSCAIRQKFSASNFWKDCVKYDCTASQYIGEICRYLLAQPVQEEVERRHKVRLLYGNGLRAEIWQEFVQRFHVRIGELYGSTEGTSNLVNTDGKVGACGFLPISPLTSRVHPVRLVKVDELTGEVLRRADGLCQPCRPGETGAMVSTIRKNNPLLIFEGYLNSAETSKKVIKDVFRKGDSVFLTGDLLHWDRLGYVYFRDRTGDTFRWKGENVSTTEVEAVLMPLKEVIDVTVYGVEVPGTEGRAGMAAIVRHEDNGKTLELFLKEIASRLTSSLPSYSIPLFIRICNAVDRTGTFKLVKTNLQRLAYSPSDSTTTTDQLFVWDQQRKHYTSLDQNKRKQLESGELL